MPKEKYSLPAFLSLASQKILGHAKPQRGVEIYIVVPGKEIAGGQLFFRQPHHLGEAGPFADGIVEVGHTHRGDDRDIAGALDDHGARVKWITHALAGIGSQSVGASYHAADGHSD